MATSTYNLMVTTDHSVPVEPLGGTATVKVNSGDTVYYNDNPAVDAAHSIASIVAGGSADLTVASWLKSAGTSSVTITRVDASTALPSSVANAASQAANTTPVADGAGGLAWTPKTTAAAWVPYSGNPLWAFATIPGATSLGGTFGDIWWDGTTFHMFTMVDGTTPGIYHGTSTDGLTGWAFDASPCLTVGAGGSWDANTVGVPCVFNVGSTLYMYYRGVDVSGNCKIGLATTSTSTPGTGWTKNGGNPLISGSTAPAAFNGNLEAGPGRIIKSGSTYYMWASIVNTGSVIVDRQGTVYTSANPDGPWAILAGTYGTTFPIFSSGRFCNNIWSDGTFFYSLVPHYRSSAPVSLVSGSQAELELWRASAPTFLPSQREFLGIVRSPSLFNAWETAQFDTPTIPSDDITRSTFNCTGGRPRVYYAGQDSSGKWLTGALVPAPALYVPHAPPKPLTMVGPWNTTTVTANQSNVQMALLGGGLSYIAVPFSCSVVSVGVNIGATGHLTAGSVTVKACKGANASPFSRQLAATLNTVNGAYASGFLEEGEWVFKPGDLIGVQVTTNGTFATTSSQIDASIGIVPR